MPGETESDRKGRVLIVDDDPMVRESLEMIFEHYGWDVVTLESGDAALELASSIDYQLAVVDHLMSGVDGVEVARQLKTRSAAPVFLLTGCIDPEIRHRAEEAGVDRFFAKPIKASALVRAADERR